MPVGLMLGCEARGCASLALPSRRMLGSPFQHSHCPPNCWGNSRVRNSGTPDPASLDEMTATANAEVAVTDHVMPYRIVKPSRPQHGPEHEHGESSSRAEEHAPHVVPRQQGRQDQEDCQKQTFGG